MKLRLSVSEVEDSATKISVLNTKLQEKERFVPLLYVYVGISQIVAVIWHFYNSVIVDMYLKHMTWYVPNAFLLIKFLGLVCRDWYGIKLLYT